MAQQAVVILKDGTKISIDDLSQLGQYSSRQDLESISFFGEDEIVDAGIPDAGIEQKTIAVVEQPKADPVIQKPQPVADNSAAITATIGALAGAISSAGMPAVMNLAKSFIKGKLKINKSSESSKPEEEKEEPTDCKTHQLKAGAKFASISARLSALENKGSGISMEGNPLEDLEERIEKLEKQLKTKGKKK